MYFSYTCRSKIPEIPIEENRVMKFKTRFCALHPGPEGPGFTAHDDKSTAIKGESPYN